MGELLVEWVDEYDGGECVMNMIDIGDSTSPQHRKALKLAKVVTPLSFIIAAGATFLYPSLPFAPQIYEEYWITPDLATMAFTNGVCWAMIMGVISYVAYRIYLYIKGPSPYG